MKIASRGVLPILKIRVKAGMLIQLSPVIVAPISEWVDESYSIILVPFGLSVKSGATV